MRTIEDIQELFYHSLQQSNSPLNAIAPGDVLYTLVRAICASYLEQDLLLADAAGSLYINARGTNLDAVAGDFGLTRKQGQRSEGYILLFTVNDNGVNIGANTDFTDPITLVQVVTAEPAGISPYTEVPVKVFSIEESSQANLKANTKLINPDRVDVTATVGSYRSMNEGGQACGDLTRGRALESDNKLRRRLINYFLSRGKSTALTIQSAVEELAYVESAYPISPANGVIQILVEAASTLTTTELTEVNAAAAPNLALGVATLPVIQLSVIFTRININVIPRDSNIDLRNLATALQQATKLLVSRLGPGQALGAAVLAAELRPFFVAYLLSIEVELFRQRANGDFMSVVAVQASPTEVIRSAAIYVATEFQPIIFN